MKRKLFFWLEKLKISRVERITVSALMAMLLILVGANALITPSSPFDKTYYREIDQAFQQRAALLEQKERQLLARYEGKNTSSVEPADTTLPPDLQIDINVADTKTLQQLPGIGPSYAERIIAYRQEFGRFARKDDLLKIKGIGKARFEKIKPLIKVSESGPDLSALAMDSLPLPAQTPKEDEAKTQAEPSSKIINVNTADAHTLQQLPGIGPAYAERIIAYRQENGPFTDKDQLLKIKGIGKKRLAKIKPFIKLTGQ